MKEYTRFTSKLLAFGLVLTLVLSLFAEYAIAEPVESENFITQIIGNKPTRTEQAGIVSFSLNRGIYGIENYDELINELLINRDDEIVLKVVFNNGGYLSTLENLIFTLNIVKNDRVETYGDAYSAGAFLSCADTEVYVEPNSKLYFHWVKISSEVTPEQTKKIYDDMQELLVDTCVKNGLLTVEEVNHMRKEADKLTPQDDKPFIYLTAQQVKQRIGDRWYEP